MQHDAEPELLLQPQHRQNVVVPMRVMMHHALAVEHFDKHLEPKIARRQLRRDRLGSRDFVAILLRGDELLADERRGLSARAGEGRDRGANWFRWPSSNRRRRVRPCS